MQGLNSNNCIQYFSIKNKKSGFSLIELSIVLIIIGLLVAGITGGQSLIESAKIRAAINKLNGLKQGTLAFYAIKGRLPGDVKNIGATGFYSDYQTYNYPPGTFASPYNKDTCSFVTAPFVELYLEGFNDYYIPSSCSGLTPTSANFPPIKYIGVDGYYWFMTFYRDKWNHFHTPKTAKVLDNIKEGSINLYFYDYSYIASADKPRAKTVVNIDKKIDDGVYNSGSFRGSCSGGNIDYDKVINDNEKGSSITCRSFLYNLGL